MDTVQSSSTERPRPSISQSEAELVQDFAHLGIAVRSGSQDISNTGETDHAKIAARVAAIKHAEPPRSDDAEFAQAKGINDTAQTKRQIDLSSSGSQTRPSDGEHTVKSPGNPATTSSTTSPGLPRVQPPHDTVDTTIAEPVVHETVKVQHVDVRQEVVHKEVHEYHEVTRILPVIETEILPARHFVLQEDGSKVEIPAPKTAASIPHSVT